MFRKSVLPLLLVCLSLASPVSAAEAEAPPEPAFAGACITRLPEQGQVLLGSRVLRPGDVLTAGQWAKIAYVPPSAGKLQEELCYLPVFAGRIAPEQTLELTPLGRKNQPPTAEDGDFETYKNLPCEGMLRFSDAEDAQLAFTLTRAPRRGSVILRPDGSFLYTPERNKVGPDAFKFTVTDPAGNVSREATVTVTIRKPTEELYYSDTAGLNCQFAAEWLRQTGIFSGESVRGQVCFSPDREVTRGQFLAMLMETLGMPVDRSAAEQRFLEDAAPWLRPYLAAALRAGIITEEPFEPEEAIPKQASLDMIRRALGYALPTAVTAWASDGLSAGDSPLTRSDAALLLYRLSRLKRPGLSRLFR